MVDQNNNAIHHNTAQDDLQASEIRYRRLFESARDGILILDAANRKITDVNPFMVEFLGYSFDELLGRELWEIGLFKDKDESQTAFQELQATGYIRYEDMPLQTKTGERWDVEFISNVYQEDGHQVIQCNIRDITARKQAANALKRQLDFTSTITNSLGEGVYAIDKKGRVIFMNLAAETLLGWTEADLLGKKMHETIHFQRADGTRVPDAECILLDVLRVGQTVRVEDDVFTRRDGTMAQVSYTSSPIISDGQVVGAVVAFHDIAERKRTEEALKASEVIQRQLLERQSAIYNALPAHICLLGGVGNILEVNAAWQEFASINNFGGSKFGIGSNYLEVCGSTAGDCSAEAQQTADGIRSVLSGESNKFELEYPCHSPKEKRWFRLTVTPLQEDASAGVVVMHVNITERKLSDEALHRAEAKYRGIVESSPAIIYLVQPVPPYAPIYVSPNIAIFGYPPDEWYSRDNMWRSLIHEEDRDRVLQASEVAMNHGLETDIEYRVVARDGTIHWVRDKGRFILDEHGNRVSWQGVMLDITKTKELEQQLKQSQKLESVGRLAGGIAHDFNNMLTAINGYSELTLRRLGAGNPLSRNIEEIIKAGQRAASLTHQLLAFSRKQLLQPVVLDLNEVIADTIQMLQRLIGEDIQLVTALNPKSGRVKVDPGQLSQIILNLAVNARDAMPQGGKITIETANVFLGPDYAKQHFSVIPGAYVMLSVSDTGIGMSAETQEHIFEPFFTTKEVGKGTGLGLATVYGIVKQSDGNIGVYSEAGHGTTFKIYLPRVAEQAEAIEKEDISNELPKGTETILIVEDEDIVRSLTREILEECGYFVLEASNGIEALSICETHDCHIDLLMTDVVMPQMGGRELSQKFAHIYPLMKILFTSGYTDDAIVRHGVIEAGTNFIQKPFTPDELAQKIRRVLDATSES